MSTLALLAHGSTDIDDVHRGLLIRHVEGAGMRLEPYHVTYSAECTVIELRSPFIML
jgi:hypothetical protein